MIRSKFFQISSLLFLLALPQVVRAEGATLTVEEFRSSLESIVNAQGGGSVARYLREQADGGVDLSALRAQVLAQNGGAPQPIPVPVHPKAVGNVVFANRMLRESGIDFFVYEALEDKSLLPPSEVEPTEVQNYRRWRGARTVIQPFMGFSATLIQAWTGGGLDAVTAAVLAQGFAVMALEAQFSIFSSQWAKLWEKDKPLIPWRIARPFAEAEEGRLKAKLNRLVDMVNGAAGVVKQSHAWNFAINWAYTLIVYGAGVVGSYIGGHPDVSFPFMSVLVGSTVFYAAFGLFQTAITSTSTRVRGEVSEILRYQTETASLMFLSLMRMVSLVPGLESVAMGVQALYFAVITVPVLARLKGSDAFARETARIFARNGGGVTGTAGFCERVLARVFELTPLRQRTTMGAMMTDLAGAARRAVGRLRGRRPPTQVSMIFIDQLALA